MQKEINKKLQKAVDYLVSLQKRIPILHKVAWEKHKIVDEWHRVDPTGAYPTSRVNEAISAHVYLLHRISDIRQKEIPQVKEKIIELFIQKRQCDLKVQYTVCKCGDCNQKFEVELPILLNTRQDVIACTNCQSELVSIIENS